MSDLVTTTKRYPGLTRLLGTLDDGWRPGATDVIDYLAGRTEVLSDAEARSLAAELARLCDTAAAEYDYVRVLVDSGARFTPYGTFGSAGEFLDLLRHRVDDCMARRSDARADGEPEPPVGPEPVPPPGRRSDPVAPPQLARLLVLLYAKGGTTPTRVLDELDHDAARLVEVGAVDLDVLADELADLLGGGSGRSGAGADDAERTEAEYARMVAGTGVHLTPDAAHPTIDVFLRALRARVTEPAAGDPVHSNAPAVVVEGTLDALKRGRFHRAMTGLVRMYGVAELRITEFALFERKVGELLDHVLAPVVADYVDDATLAAQTVGDDRAWTRVRWMRSAVEILVTAHTTRAAARYVDREQLAYLDQLLRAPTCRFAPVDGRVSPRFPNSHWWWTPAPPGSTDAHRAGLPVHPRWFPADAVWRVTVPPPVAEHGGDAAVAAALAADMVRASVTALGEHFEPRRTTVMVQVLDGDGSVVWADASLSARLSGNRVVVTDPGYVAAPVGERVPTCVTVRGVFGHARIPAEWSVEVLRGRGDDGREVTSSGSAVLALSGADRGLPAIGDRLHLEAVLRAWTVELGAPVLDWRSRAWPHLVSRRGLSPELFAGERLSSHALRVAVSRQLWAGDLRPGLVGLARVLGGTTEPVEDLRHWRTDWVAALADAGSDAVDAVLAELVDETRALDYPRWLLLCAARSGLQLVGDELADDRLAGLVSQAGVRALDDAMRTFGHRVGPAGGEHMPAGLANHPWWGYPEWTENAGRPLALAELTERLWAELDRPERDRRTKAPTRSLASVLRVVRRVADGEVAGLSTRVAGEIVEQVTDRWDLGAALTDQLLRYVGPVATAVAWPTPGRKPQHPVRALG